MTCIVQLSQRVGLPSSLGASRTWPLGSEQSCSWLLMDGQGFYWSLYTCWICHCLHLWMCKAFVSSHQLSVKGLKTLKYPFCECCAILIILLLSMLTFANFLSREPVVHKSPSIESWSSWHRRAWSCSGNQVRCLEDQLHTQYWVLQGVGGSCASWGSIAMETGTRGRRREAA